MIVHLGTKVETFYGVIDENGNLIKQIPYKADLPIVGPEELANIGIHLQLAKKRLEAEEAASKVKPAEETKSSPAEVVLTGG